MERQGALHLACMCAEIRPSSPPPFPDALLQELGVQILSDLQRQRETILHSRDTLHTVRAAAGLALDACS